MWVKERFFTQNIEKNNHKRKNRKLDFIKIKDFCSSKVIGLGGKKRIDKPQSDPQDLQNMDLTKD